MLPTTALFTVGVALRRVVSDVLAEDNVAIPEKVGCLDIGLKANER